MFCKLVLKEKFKNYSNSLLLLNLETLQERRNKLSLEFAKSGIKNNTLRDLLPEQDNSSKINTRKQEKFKVTFANTERLKNSSIIFMQNQLNNDAM